jgi:hypothetical protein
MAQGRAHKTANNYMLKLHAQTHIIIHMFSPGVERGYDTEEISYSEGNMGDNIYSTSIIDEGMTNRPSTFAYLVFGPGGIDCRRSCEAHRDGG